MESEQKKKKKLKTIREEKKLMWLRPSDVYLDT